MEEGQRPSIKKLEDELKNAREAFIKAKIDRDEKKQGKLELKKQLMLKRGASASAEGSGGVEMTALKNKEMSVNGIIQKRYDGTEQIFATRWESIEDRKGFFDEFVAHVTEIDKKRTDQGTGNPHGEITRLLAVKAELEEEFQTLQLEARCLEKWVNNESASHGSSFVSDIDLSAAKILRGDFNLSKLPTRKAA